MRLRTATDVGLTIRERRRNLGLDQKTLARLVGVSRQWVIDAEKGKKRTQLGLILRTFNALDLELRTGEPPPPPDGGMLPASAVDLDRLIQAPRGRPRPKP